MQQRRPLRSISNVTFDIQCVEETKCGLFLVENKAYQSNKFTALPTIS